MPRCPPQIPNGLIPAQTRERLATNLLTHGMAIGNDNYVSQLFQQSVTLYFAFNSSVWFSL
jgi:hypothetical protein